jgi:putative DNA primase/helicase
MNTVHPPLIPIDGVVAVRYKTADQITTVFSAVEQIEIRRGVKFDGRLLFTSTPEDAAAIEQWLADKAREETEFQNHWSKALEAASTACRSQAFLKNFRENDLIHELASWLMIFGDRDGKQLYREVIEKSGALDGVEDADYIISDVWNDRHESPGDWKKLIRYVREVEDGDEPAPITIGAVPEASYATTDQANAARLAAHFGSKELISVGGLFHHFNGKYWERNERKAMECGAQLSSIVGDEAQAWRAKFESMAAVNPDGKKLEATVRRDKSKLEDNLRATSDGLAMVNALNKAEALEKHQKSCEMITNIRNAVEMLRNLATVDADHFDTNPTLLNCQNGTIDLRTGRLREHDARHLITHCARVKYNPNVKAPRFEKFLNEILTPDQVGFAQRWFGYCATGEISEQKILLNIGEGANGKGTLIEAIEDALGDYSHTAPVGMLTAVKGEERHPTEIADLFRKRMVTASESDHDASLREAFVKLVTGGDRLTGRYMGKDFFKFYPTHKLQMLTNHKPSIRGSDYGIWRRILLLQYNQKFGTAEDVASGRATKLVDTSLKGALLAEREGIFAWIVQGAIDWYRDGLRPPACVLAANEEYRKEQDRVGQFVHECCVLESGTWSPFSSPFIGLYPAYAGWCRESGYQALGMKKFIDELARVVPGFRKAERKLSSDGVRKTVNGAFGVKVNIDGPSDSANGDLVGEVTK